jgi:hypothetical protein
MESNSSNNNRDDVSNNIADFFKSVNSDKTSTKDIRDAVLESPSSSSSFLSFTGFFAFLSSVPWYFWFIFVLILAFLGFNIFIYLAKGTQDISNFFGPIAEWMFSFLGMTAKQTAEVAGAGAAALAVSGIELSAQGENALAEDAEITQNTALYNDLNQQTSEIIGGGVGAYQADDSSSLIQQNKSSGKAGWCYIGEDRGFRSCIKVGENDKCMSGDIFPSRDICINPSLRP